MSNIGKELAAREIAKALSKLSVDELKKIAETLDVDISDALEGEYFTKADLGDEDESLTSLAKRIGNHPLIDAAKKLDAITKRLDATDAQIVELSATIAKNLDEIKAVNAKHAAAYVMRPQ
jgi:hypothetical protein